MITTKDMSVNALIFNIKGEFDDAIDNYREFVKEAYDLKVDKENKTTYIIKAVDLPHISVKRGDVKTYLIHTDSMNVMAFTFLLGYDVFLSSKENPLEMAQFKKYVIDFMDFQYQAYYAGVIKGQNKDLDGTKKDLSQKEGKISSLKKKVVSLAKKKEKETDATKKVAINAEMQLTENEINELVDQVTALRVEVSQKEKGIYKLKGELNKFHLQITSF
jgi:peptidoglycan hydrolase CwlO-like protein